MLQSFFLKVWSRSLNLDCCLHRSLWQDLVKALDEAASAAGLRLRALDKKAERAALQAQRQALQASISQESDPATALSQTVPLLVLQVTDQPCNLSHYSNSPVCLPVLSCDKHSLHALLDDHVKIVDASCPFRVQLSNVSAATYFAGAQLRRQCSRQSSERGHCKPER